MAYRFVRDYDRPGRYPASIYADAERRVWLVSFVRPHPTDQTEYHVDLEYGFDTAIGQEIGRLVFGNPIVTHGAAATADARG